MTPDDKHLLVTFYDQAILWNLESGAATTLNRAVSTPDLRNPWMAMRGAFSPDSQRLALQTGDRQVSLWKTDALDSPITIDLSMPVHGQISFSSSEPLLAIYCLDAKEKKCEVVVWDYAKSEQRTRIATSFPVGTVATALAFDPQGRRLAVSERAGVSIYDLAQSTPLLQWPAHPLGITQLAWGADGQQLISTGIDGKLKIWELSTQPMLTQISTGTPLEGFVFSPDGRWLAVTPSGGGAIELVDRENDKPLRQISTHGAIVFRRDGQQLTAIPTDAIKDIMQLMQPGATKAAAPVASVVVEDTLSGREVSQGTVEGSVLAAAFTPGGDLPVSTFHPQDGSSAIRNINTNEMVWKSADGSRILPLLNADGTLSALAEVDVLQTKPLTIWDLAAGRQLAQWTPPGFSPYLAFSPDNRWAAVVSVNLAGLFLPTGGNTGGEASRELGQMLVTTWSLPAGERQLTIPCNSPYRSLAFSPDGRLLAMTSTEDGVQLWSTERNEPVFRLTPAGGASQSMAFAPDGRLAWCVESQPQIHLLDLSALREQLARIHLDW
jgi:WD40 repeat protein